MSLAKTILIAHSQAAVRDRFAAALADARHAYVTAETEAAAIEAAGTAAAPVSLALVDLGMAEDGVGLIRAMRAARPKLPIVVFAGTVASADDVRELIALGVAGYVNEHAPTPQILPALAPHLFPDSFDRRASARVTLGIPVSFRAGHTIAGALTLNIGKGGLAIRTMSPLGTGTALQVRFQLPGMKDDIDTAGRIAWSDRKIGMGIQFDVMDASAQALIDQFVDAHT